MGCNHACRFKHWRCVIILLYKLQSRTFLSFHSLSSRIRQFNVCVGFKFCFYELWLSSCFSASVFIILLFFCHVFTLVVSSYLHIPLPTGTNFSSVINEREAFLRGGVLLL
jgi:hypothetical protein